MNFEKRDDVCDDITRVNDTLNGMMDRIKTLKTYHFKHTKTMADTDTMFLMTDPLYFQYKVLEMEIDFWKEIIRRFSHRVHADYFKFLNILYENDRSKIENHVFHHDLCFEGVDVNEIVDLKKDIQSHIKRKKRDLDAIEKRIITVLKDTERGVNVQSILNSENHIYKNLQNKISFWEECIYSHEYYHKKFLISLKLKILTMNTEMNESVDIDTYDASESLLLDTNEKKQTNNFVSKSNKKLHRKWTFSTLESLFSQETPISNMEVPVADASPDEVSNMEVPVADAPSVEVSNMEVPVADAPSVEVSNMEVPVADASSVEVSNMEVPVADASPDEVPKRRTFLSSLSTWCGVTVGISAVIYAVRLYPSEVIKT